MSGQALFPIVGVTTCSDEGVIPTRLPANECSTVQ